MDLDYPVEIIPRTQLQVSTVIFKSVQVILSPRRSRLECISQRYKGYLFVGARKWRLNGVHAGQFKFRLSVIQTSKEGWLLWNYRGSTQHNQFRSFFQILLLNGPKTVHLLQFSQRVSLIRPLLYNRQSADQSTFVLLNRWDAWIIFRCWIQNSPVARSPVRLGLRQFNPILIWCEKK